MPRYRPAAGTLASVAIATAAFPPHDYSIWMWIALVPWLVAISRCHSAKEAAAQGFWLDFLLGLCWGTWLPASVSEYLGVPFFMGLIVLALQSVIHQLHLIFFAPLFFRLLNTGIPFGSLHIAVAALAFCALDWLLPNIFQHTLGWALHGSSSFVQLTEIGGPRFLTFIILVGNLGLFTATNGALATREPLRRWLPALGFTLCVVGGSWGYGALRYEQVSAAIEAPLRTLQVGIVQGNISNDVRRRWSDGDPEAARETLKLYIGETEKLLGLTGDTRPNVVVWPETSYPGIFRRPENEEQAQLNVALDQYIAERGLPFIFGAYDREDRTDRRVLHNAIFVVQPQPNQAHRALSPMDVYHKHILFPVGETLPFVSENFVRRWLPRAGRFATGDGPKVLPIQISSEEAALHMGPTICYEDLFPSHAIEMARMGAQLIINVSNDSWFGNRGLPRFHLIVAKLRSIETRLPQVRATNTGYSGLVLPNGDVPYESNYGKTQAMNLRVPIISAESTPMVRWGDWFGPTSLIVSAPALAFMLRRRCGAEGARAANARE